MTTASAITVRVWVPDVWDILDMSVTPDYTIAQLKSEALERAFGKRVDTSEYEIKFRGALVTDESKTLRDLQVPDKGPLIILPARRRPVM